MTGTLQCQCGKVIFHIGDTTPRMKLECGCCDCRQALSWCEIQGGPKLPSHRPVIGMYFGNDILVVSGKENLQWYKLRENGSSIRWVARCCMTTYSFSSQYIYSKTERLYFGKRTFIEFISINLIINAYSKEKYPHVVVKGEIFLKLLEDQPCLTYN